MSKTINQQTLQLNGFMDKETFDTLLSLEKFFKSKKITLTHVKSKSEYELYSFGNNKSKFFLNVQRGNKYSDTSSKTQLRYSQLPMLRLEIDCAPHFNIQTGEHTDRNHIHFIYNNENHAYNLSDISEIKIYDYKNFNDAFYNFCIYVNIDIEDKFTQGVI